MTVSPPPPTDDELRAWAEVAQGPGRCTRDASELRLFQACHALLGEREAHSATRAALAALQHTARDVLDDYFGNVADGGESPERSYLRSLAAQCDVDFEQRMSEL